MPPWLTKYEYKSFPDDAPDKYEYQAPAPDVAEKEESMADNAVTALIKKLEAVDNKLDALEKRQWESQPRVVGGQVFPLGDPRRPTSLGGAPTILHSRGESAYSLVKAMRSLVERDKSIAPLEWAISEKLAQMGYHPISQGLMVPLGMDVWSPPGREQEAEALNQEIKGLYPTVAIDPDEVAWLSRKMGGAKAMDPLDESTGGSTIPYPSLGAPIDLMRAQSVVLRAGAYPVPLPPQGSISFPRLTADASFTWGPPPNVPINENDAATGALSLTAKRATALVVLPQDLVRFSMGAAESMVQRSLTARGALTLDLAALEGTGGTAAPLGITRYPLSANDTPTVDQVTAHIAKITGAAGDTFDPSDVLVMLGNVSEANTEATAFIMRPRMWSGILNSRADAVVTGDHAGLFLFTISRGDAAAAIPTSLSGTPVLTSTQVAKNRVKGNGTGLTYIICGDWSKLYIGQGAAVELTTSTDYKFAEDQLALKAILRADVGAAWPQAFCLCDQLIIPS